MTEMSPSDRAVLLVPSCDRYSDVWAPFFALLQRHWPDCPFPIVVGSNHEACAEGRVRAITVGDDRDWTSGLRAMLTSLNVPHVLILLEDFLLTSRVDTALVQALLDDLVRLDGAYLRLRPFPPPDARLVRFPRVGEIAPGAPYRAAMQAAFWHRESLLELLQDGENPWQMEVLGARRSDSMARGFYSTWVPALDYYAGVTMGRWIPYAVALCREHGVMVDLTRRPMMSPRENARRAMGRLANVTLDLLPWPARERLFRWFRATGLRRPPAGLTR